MSAPAPRTGFQRLKTGSHAVILRVFLDELHGHHDRREHIVQIMRQPAGERADAFEALAAKQLRFQLFLVGDVAIDDENGLGFAVRLAHQRPAAVNGQLVPVAGFLFHLARPRVLVLHGLQRAGGFKWIVRRHQFVSGAARGFRRRPAVKPRRARVPINNAVGKIADENRVAGDVQQRRLRTNLLVGADVFGDVLQAHQHADRVAKLDALGGNQQHDIHRLAVADDGLGHLDLALAAAGRERLQQHAPEIAAKTGLRSGRKRRCFPRHFCIGKIR